MTQFNHTHDFDNDPLLDSALAETLGGKTPPDLSARILQAWSERSRAPSVSVAPRKGRRDNTSSLTVVISLTAAAAVLLIALVNLAKTKPHQGAVAKKPAPAPQEVASPKKLPTAVPTRVESKPSVPQFAKSPEPAPSPKNVEPLLKPTTKEEPPVVAKTPSATTEEIVAFVNQQLHQTWQEHKIQPAPLAADDQWCRRLFVRLIGRIPTVEELRAFQKDRSPDKREHLVDLLLTDDEYKVDYARHWSTVWANILIGRGVGLERGEIASRAGLEKYLRDAFAANKPFNQIATELLSATGSGEPGADNFNGATNYLLACDDEKGIAATARTCRVFLGAQLQCAQCHNHPTEPWKQEQFWSMNAFFRQVKARHERNDPAQLLDFDYLGDDGRDREGLVYFERANGTLGAAGPQFIDGRKPHESSGLVADMNRRETLAQYITHSDLFAQALVNRVWSQFHGYGFTQPIDDLGPASQVSHPEMLQRLAQEFSTQGHDLKRMYKWVALSDAFQRSSQPSPGAITDAPAAGTAPLFSYYYQRPLQGEEVIRSLQIAAQLRRDVGTQGNITQARVDWLAQYQRAAAKGDMLETPPIPTSDIIPSGLMKHATATGYEGLLQSVLQAKLPFEAKVEHLFLSALSRKPTKQELAAAKKLAGTSSERESAALEDIWWALVHSSEFLVDH